MVSKKREAANPSSHSNGEEGGMVSVVPLFFKTRDRTEGRKKKQTFFIFGIRRWFSPSKIMRFEA
jgi:hypothetical protein